MAYVSAYRQPHESFPQPEDGSLKVWRYLDLEKLVAILSSGQLLFTRVDLLGDEFEGSVTRGVYDYWKVNPHNAEVLARARPEFKRMVYASCWHMNNAESEAMWRLYCGRKSGIALQTTYQRLDQSLPAVGVLLGKVTYVDYDDATAAPMPNAFSPIMHKRTAFEHEREVRALIWRKAKLLAEGVPIEQFPPGEPSVIGVPCDLDATVENVFVSPYAEEWYRDVVKEVLLKFAPVLVNRLVWSRMKGVPLY